MISKNGVFIFEITLELYLCYKKRKNKTNVNKTTNIPNAWHSHSEIYGRGVDKDDLNVEIVFEIEKITVNDFIV